MMILMSHKVRNRAPEPQPAPPVPAPEPKRGRGRPPGPTQQAPEKLHYPSICGIELTRFEAIPSALRNRIISGFARAIAAVMSMLQEFYLGTDRNLLEFLIKKLPPVIFALGRAIMTELLTEERGHLGQEIGCHCDGCSQKLTYQGDVKTTIKTVMGEIVVARSYYHGEGCGHSAWPLDLRLGLGRHSALPDLLELITHQTTSQSFPEALKSLRKALPFIPLSHGFIEAVTATDADYVKLKLDEEVEEMKADPGKAASLSGGLKPAALLVTSDGGFCRVRDHDEPSHEFKIVGFGELEFKSPALSPRPKLPRNTTECLL